MHILMHYTVLWQQTFQWDTEGFLWGVTPGRSGTGEFQGARSETLQGRWDLSR